MSFMLGSFTQGLTEGARDVYGIANAASQIDHQKAQTESMRQETDFKKKSFEAGQDLAKEGSKPMLDTAPAGGQTGDQPSGQSGGQSAGTTSTGPVAPTTFDHLPTPAHMQAVQTGGSGDQSAPSSASGDQSAPGSASGFGPSYNPEAGPAAAAQSALPTNAPGAAAPPTMATPDVRNAPAMGGTASPFPGGVNNPSTQGATAAPKPAPTPQQTMAYRAQRALNLPPIAGGSNTHNPAPAATAPQVFAGGAGTSPGAGTNPAAPVSPVPQPTAGIPVPPSHTDQSTMGTRIHEMMHTLGTPLRGNWPNGGDDAPPARDVSPARQRRMNRQTSDNNVGRHIAGALNIG